MIRFPMTTLMKSIASILILLPILHALPHGRWNRHAMMPLRETWPSLFDHYGNRIPIHSVVEWNGVAHVYGFPSDPRYFYYPLLRTFPITMFGPPPPYVLYFPSPTNAHSYVPHVKRPVVPDPSVYSDQRVAEVRGHGVAPVSEVYEMQEENAYALEVTKPTPEMEESRDAQPAVPEEIQASSSPAVPADADQAGTGEQAALVPANSDTVCSEARTNAVELQVDNTHSNPNPDMESARLVMSEMERQLRIAANRESLRAVKRMRKVLRKATRFRRSKALGSVSVGASVSSKGAEVLENEDQDETDSGDPVVLTSPADDLSDNVMESDPRFDELIHDDNAASPTAAVEDDRKDDADGLRDAEDAPSLEEPTSLNEQHVADSANAKDGLQDSRVISHAAVSTIKHNDEDDASLDLNKEQNDSTDPDEPPEEATDSPLASFDPLLAQAIEQSSRLDTARLANANVQNEMVHLVHFITKKGELLSGQVLADVLIAFYATINDFIRDVQIGIAAAEKGEDVVRAIHHLLADQRYQKSTAREQKIAATKQRGKIRMLLRQLNECLNAGKQILYDGPALFAAAYVLIKAKDPDAPLPLQANLEHKFTISRMVFTQLQDLDKLYYETTRLLEQ